MVTQKQEITLWTQNLVFESPATKDFNLKLPQGATFKNCQLFLDLYLSTLVELTGVDVNGQRLPASSGSIGAHKTYVISPYIKYGVCLDTACINWAGETRNRVELHYIPPSISPLPSGTCTAIVYFFYDTPNGGGVKNAAFLSISVVSQASPGETVRIYPVIKNTGSVAATFQVQCDLSTGIHLAGAYWTLEPGQQTIVRQDILSFIMPSSGDVQGTIWIEGSGPFARSRFYIRNRGVPGKWW